MLNNKILQYDQITINKAESDTSPSSLSCFVYSMDKGKQ